MSRPRKSVIGAIALPVLAGGIWAANEYFRPTPRIFRRLAIDLVLGDYTSPRPGLVAYIPLSCEYANGYDEPSTTSVGIAWWDDDVSGAAIEQDCSVRLVKSYAPSADYVFAAAIAVQDGTVHCFGWNIQTGEPTTFRILFDGSTVPSSADLDRDGDVDQTDFGLFQRQRPMSDKNQRQTRDAELLAVRLIIREYSSASRANGAFRSSHEGYAVILEELDELWVEVKKRAAIRDRRAICCEAIQVGAMAMRFLVDLVPDLLADLMEERRGLEFDPIND